MRRQLIRLVLWVLHWLVQDAVYLIVPNDALTAKARLLTAAQEQFADRSGEAKRHQVYSALIKAFPYATKRAIALAIEAALSDGH